MSRIQCHVFAEFPGQHPSWSLAVMAVNLSDARQYVQAWHKGGKLQYSPAPGTKVTASCGGTTEAAQAIIRADNEREQREWERNQ